MNVNTLRVLVIFALVLTAVCVTADAEPGKDPPGNDSGFVPLFDGKSMKGWVGNVGGYEAVSYTHLRAHET